MIDLVLDIGIVADICLERGTHFTAALAAFEKAKTEGTRIWLYTGSVQALQYVLANRLRRTSYSEQTLSLSQSHELARRLIGRFSESVHWLAALAEDGLVFNQSSPEDAQLVRAVARLGEHALLLTRNEALLKTCPQAVSPQSYLERPWSDRSIEFIDLRSQQDAIRPGIEQSVHRVLHHSGYILGLEVEILEKRLAEYVGVEHCLAVSSGTDALLLALMAKNIGPGDAVFIPAFTFVATAEVVVLLRATPIFVDIDADSYLMDIQSLEGAIVAAKAYGLTPRAIIPVDLFGQPAPYEAIQKLADTTDLWVLADAAQSFGASRFGKRVGSLAPITVTSFFPSKPLGGYGDGGAIFTDDIALAHHLYSLRVHGQGKDGYENVNIGINGRLDTLQAAILLEKLKIFDSEIRARQRIAERYHQGLKDVAVTPVVADGSTSVWAQYTIRIRDRDPIATALKKQGIPTAVYYPIPLHRQSAYERFPHATGGLEVSERLAREVLSLPIHPYLEEVIQDTIITAVRKAIIDAGCGW